MHNEMMYWFLANGYDGGILGATCATKFAVGGKSRTTREICKEDCNNNPDCKFFFFNEKNWCGLYSSCDQLRTTKDGGTTYKKIRGM